MVNYWNNGTCTFGVACTGPGFTSPSDEKLKDNVQDIDLSSVFDAVSVKRYERNDLKGRPHRVGFIAQEIKAAIDLLNVPDCFTAKARLEDGEEVMTLDYSRLATVLWSKLKQVENRLAVLEKKKTKSK